MHELKPSKMDALVKRLAAEAGEGDPVHGVARLRREMAKALLIGTAVVALIVLFLFGGRSDILTAIAHAPVFLKFAIPLGIAASGMIALVRLAQPGVRAASPGTLLPLLGAILLALLFWSDGGTLSRLIAEGSVAKCIATITCLSFIPLDMLLSVMRSGAPTRPALAGSAAGATAGAAAAFGYAFYCPVDSVSFVVVSYTSAIAVAALLGGVLGRRRIAW